MNIQKHVERLSGVAALSPAAEGEILLQAAVLPRAEVVCRKGERGVEVEILLGHKGDNLISEVSAAREVYNLARRGAKVWLCKDCFHHDKLMVVDDTLCTVGTANLDARSLSFDYEVNAFFISPEYCNELNHYFDKHIKSSVRLTEDNWKELYPRSKRRIGWWLKGIRGIL